MSVKRDVLWCCIFAFPFFCFALLVARVVFHFFNGFEAVYSFLSSTFEAFAFAGGLVR